MPRALTEKDEETRRELEEETKRLQEQVKIAKDEKVVSVEYAEEEERMKTKVKETEHETMGSGATATIPVTQGGTSVALLLLIFILILTVPTFFFLNTHTVACQRLIERSFSLEELPSLIEVVFSSKDEADVIRRLCGDGAQTFIDVIDEVLLPPPCHHEIQLIEDTFC